MHCTHSRLLATATVIKFEIKLSHTHVIRQPLAIREIWRNMNILRLICRYDHTVFNTELCMLPQTDRATLCVNCFITVWQQVATTNPEEIDVMELDGYSWPTCRSNKPCTSSHEALDRRRVLLTIPSIVAKLSKYSVRGKVPQGSTIVFGGTRIPYNTVEDRSQKAPMPQTSYDPTSLVV